MSPSPRAVVIAAASLGRSGRTLPLGAARVVSALRSHPAVSGRLNAVLLAGLATDDAEGLARAVLAHRPWAVGLSLYVWNRALLLSTARALRRADPALVLFAGGPEAGADPAGVIKEGGLAFAVAGEGEEAAALALRRVLDGEPPAGIPGVHAAAAGRRRSSDAPIQSGRGKNPREPDDSRAQADLALVPSPYLDGVLDVAAYGGALWELARGCPFACHFCYESKGCRGVRRFSDDRALEELRSFVRSGARDVFVLDPTFNADPAKARQMLALIRREAPGIHFTFEARAEFLDAPLARAFAALSCSVQIGLQSARPEVLAAVGRPGFERGAFRRKTALLSAAGVVFGLDLIYGLPGDSLDGFRDSLDFALALEPNHLDLFRLSILPGTVLADGAEALGMERETAPPYRTLSTPDFPARDLDAAETLARVCSLFYCEGRAVGWFLPVLRPLRVRPSAFFERLLGRIGAFPDARDPSAPPVRHADIEAFQLETLAAAYREAGADRLFPAARDLVRLHGAWSRALAEGERTELSLSRHPDDLFGPASHDLARLVRAARERPGLWIVRPGDRGPILEPKGHRN